MKIFKEPRKFKKDEDYEKYMKHIKDFIRTETSHPIKSVTEQTIPTTSCLCIDTDTKEMLADIITDAMVDTLEKLKHLNFVEIGTIKLTESNEMIYRRSFFRLYSSLLALGTTKNCDELTKEENESIFNITSNYRLTTKKEKEFYNRIFKQADNLQEEYLSIIKTL